MRIKRYEGLCKSVECQRLISAALDHSDYVFDPVLLESGLRELTFVSVISETFQIIPKSSCDQE